MITASMSQNKMKIHLDMVEGEAYCQTTRNGVQSTGCYEHWHTTADYRIVGDTWRYEQKPYILN